MLCLCVRNGCVRGDLSLLCWFRDCVVICEIIGFEIVLWLLVCFFSCFFWLFCRSLRLPPLFCVVQTGCIYKRGALATKGLNLGHQGFETWMTASVGLVWTKKIWTLK